MAPSAYSPSVCGACGAATASLRKPGRRSANQSRPSVPSKAELTNQRPPSLRHCALPPVNYSTSTNLRINNKPTQRRGSLVQNMDRRHYPQLTCKTEQRVVHLTLHLELYGVGTLRSRRRRVPVRGPGSSQGRTARTTSWPDSSRVSLRTNTTRFGFEAARRGAHVCFLSAWTGWLRRCPVNNHPLVGPWTRCAVKW